MAYDRALAGRVPELLVDSRKALAAWVGRGAAVADSLPPEAGRP